MMSQNSKKELVETIQPRYRKATRNEKRQILDELVAITGYHRKHAVRILNQWVGKRYPKKPGPIRIYQGEVVIVLERIWEICGRICSKRLHPFLPEIVRVLERNNELQMSAETKNFCYRSVVQALIVV
jgi:hypothetical protein